MPPRTAFQRARDILEAIERINEFVEGMKQADFCRSPVTIDAVIYNLLIIGEAANHIPNHIKEVHPSIPWRQMIDMRHFTAHVYWGTDSNLVWDTIENHLPPLKQAMDQIQRELSE